jgi:hypothetical protein
MTKEEAINYFKRSFAIGEGDDEKYHNEVLEYTIKALEQQPITDVSSNVLHKIAEFFSNWDGDENAKMEISVDDMREIAFAYSKKARIERRLTEIKPIGYRECSDAMLKMWMDNVLTDGEYYRIMDKLNAKWSKMDEVTE